MDKSIRDVLSDPNLSWEGKGLLSYVISLGGFYGLSKRHFYVNHKGCKSKVDRMFEELKELNYIKIEGRSITLLVENEPIIGRKPTHNLGEWVETRPIETEKGGLTPRENNTPPIVPPKRGKAVDPDVLRIETWIEGNETLKSLYSDFVAHRKEIGKPLGDRAKKMFLRKLEKESESKYNLAIKMLEMAIEHNWQTIYALKQDQKNELNRQTTGKPKYKKL